MANNLNQTERNENKNLLWTLLTFIVIAVLAFAAYEAYRGNETTLYSDRTTTTYDNPNTIKQ